MMLPRTQINVIKSNLSNAVAAKNPSGVAAAVELPPFPVASGNATSGGGAGSSAVHGEQLKVDGIDWSGVLNSLLDTHAAIRSVCVVFVIAYDKTSLLWIVDCLSLSLAAPS